MNAIDKVNKFFNREYLIVIAKKRGTMEPLAMYALMGEQGYKWVIVQPNGDKARYTFVTMAKDAFMGSIDKRTIKLLDKVSYPWDKS